VKTLLCALTVVVSASGFGFSYFDGEFTAGIWQGPLVHQDTGGVPDAFGSYSVATGGGGMVSYRSFYRNDYTYNPSVSGALTNLHMSVDFEHSQGNHATGFVLLQGGNTFFHFRTSTPITPPWQHVDALNLTSANFHDYFGALHPDFSATGSEICFGATIQYISDSPATFSGGIDNFLATNQPVPEPGILIALGAGIALSRRRRTR
jgi:hypothetical protein